VIGIIDYGLGNVRAFLNMFRRMNIDAKKAGTPAELADASKIVLPGVGAFDHAMELLDTSGLRGTLERRVLEDKVPVLGVCVGMQILLNSSDEGRRKGLGWVAGRARAFRHASNSCDLPLPHMGWNDVRAITGDPLLAGLDQESRFYFLHSFYAECENDDDVIARAEYGIDFCCALRCGNVYGAQFHPEKSHRYGARLLKNFAEL
jgi:glutamine amidotransferase